MAELKVNLHYPHNEQFDWETRMVYINLDEERKKDITEGKGFIIKSPKPIKDDLKDPEGIFSTRYGPTLQDLNAYADRYKCKCGYLRMRINNGNICPICNSPAMYVDDDFSYFGWLVLKDDYYVIHSSLFMAIASFIGYNTLINIIKINKKINEDGQVVETSKAPKGEPFYGIGMMEFYDRFDEIMSYYYDKSKSPAKKEYYDDIMRNRDKVFTHSIPVFTTLLRPYRLEGGELHYEDTNAVYKIMATLVSRINNDKFKINKKAKMKNELLFDLQMKIKKLFDEICAIMSGKKGTLRNAYGGRFNFTSRSVIVPNNNNRIDEITLSYQCLCGLYQQTIINILNRSYNMSYNDAYEYLEEHRKEEDSIIRSILEGLIEDRKRRGLRGLPMIINRNQLIGFRVCRNAMKNLPFELLETCDNLLATA